MIKNVLEDIGGVGLYGIISICLFFTVFTAALIWTLLRRTSFCQTMSALPLQDESEDPAMKGTTSHE